jgi:hypothetical protein
LVENQFGKSFKILRSYNGRGFFSQEGIQRQYTTTYTPQQNEVVDRENHMIIDMARCMLENKSIPNKYGVETIHTLVYLLNWSSTKLVSKKNLEEAWYGQKGFMKVCSPKSIQMLHEYQLQTPSM